MPPTEIQYSDKYFDAEFEYRHVILPPDIARIIPRTHLMTETEWRNLGVQQSPGWVHYSQHNPEPHILLFRRPIPPTPTETVGTSEANSTTTSMVTATVAAAAAAN